VRGWPPERVAAAAGAELVRGTDEPGPTGAAVDSRGVRTGELFVGIAGAHADGGAFAAAALAAGAWGALVGPERARELPPGRGAVLAAGDPAAALGRLARAWRRELGAEGAEVVGVTGSTGKTSTKDMLAGLLAPHRSTVASRANFNTEIGLPLELLGAPAGTDILVLEMGMRGPGQIAELAAIAEPDVGVVVSVGPVHLELLGSLEAIAAAKAELIAALRPGSTAVVPAHEPLLAPHLREDLATVTFGEGGDVRLLAADGHRVTVDVAGEPVALEVPFTQPHQRANLLAALAAARAVGVTPRGRAEIKLSAGRGQRSLTAGGVLVIDDCYNANPMSMRAALDDLAEHPGRKVAVLGDMLELGPAEHAYHQEVGAHAAARGVDVLVTVGPRAAAMASPFGGEAHAAGDAGEAAELVPALLRAGDAVLVKASNGVGLRAVVEALAEH
jgi:UDP-N-acetylmuramoyl-tripeptide--D-alanyl-D-alanine ligase